MVTWSEVNEIARLFSAAIWTYSTTSRPRNIQRIQVGPKSFVTCQWRPKDPIGKLLIVQGGLYHFNKDTFYVRKVIQNLPQYQIYIFEHLEPVLDFSLSSVLDSAIQIVAPSVVVGFSFGGILLWKYLSDGYNSAPKYILVSCPMNISRFYQETVNQSFYCGRLLDNVLRDYSLPDRDTLLRHFNQGIQVSEYISEIFPRLSSETSWIPKTIWVFGEYDTLLTLWQEDVSRFPGLEYHLVANGSHCCTQTIEYTINLIQEVN